MDSISSHLCPVCGFPDLDKPAYDSHGCASFGVCPSCGTEFGYDDSLKTHLQLRCDWVRDGMRWRSQATAEPPGWTAIAQLKRAGMRLPAKDIDRPTRIPEEPIYSMRISFELAAGTFLWANNEATLKEFDFPIMSTDLPISSERAEEIEALVLQFDQSFDLSDPGRGSLWDNSTVSAFDNKVAETVQRLRAELGPTWVITKTDTPWLAL